MELIAMIAVVTVGVVGAFAFYVNRKNIELRDNVVEEFKKFAEKSQASAERRIDDIKAKL